MKKTKTFLSLVLAFTLAMSMAITGSCSDESVAEMEASEDAENRENEKNLRRIPLENASNFRDLGGYPTEDGKVTKWGILYRSNALSDLTSEDWEMLPDDDDALLNLYGSEPKTISALLDSFESEDIRECLAESGFGEEKQAELVALMTE